MPKMMPPDFDPEWSPVSEEIVFRAVQENLPTSGTFRRC